MEPSGGIESVPTSPPPPTKNNTPLSQSVWRIGLIILLLLIAAGVSYLFAPRTILVSISKAFDNNDFKAALSRIDVLLGRNPDDTDALITKALVLAQQGSIEFKESEYGAQAVEIANQAIAADPENSEAHRVLAYAYEIQQQYTQAHEEYAKAIALDATNAAALFGDAHTYDLQGMSDKAEAGYRQTIAAGEAFGKAHAGLARILAGKGDIPGALAEYDLAYKYTTNIRERAEAAYSMGVLHLSANDIERAKVYFDDANRADASYALGWYGTGTILFQMSLATSSSATTEQRVQAMNASFDALAKAVSLNPKQTLAYMQLAVQHMFLKHADTALEALDQAAAVVDQDITLSARDKEVLKENIQKMRAGVEASSKAQ